ncbi:MAG: glycoside hydrolase family 3 C-terminal domain-containing protein, partial [Prevotellaceae bacterium]|nr:glycoside hydrolase family 3 C-terminal domain-containing protein [Prevotellaceae bacterium]
VGRTSGEFEDRKTADFYLNETEKSLIKAVTEAFHKAGKKAVVILNIGGVVETASWKAQPDAILLAWQAGQEGGNTVADVLSGKVNPSGRLPMTFPLALEDVPSYPNVPRDYTPANPMETMMGGSSIDGDRPNIDFTRYEEDIYVGYRYYGTHGKEVSYPFGYGLSYAAFEYANASVSENKGVYTVSVEVKNTGAAAGKEVVQLYVSAPAGELPKPVQELKAFAKTKALNPGEAQTVTLTFTGRDLASFSEAKNDWVTDAGTYQLLIGASSQDVRQQLDMNISN